MGATAALSSFSGLKASQIQLSFGGFQALKSVDIELKPGSIHAITGENGAGKSSLGKVIAGLYRADQGSVILDGQPISLKSARDGLRHGIALIHQEPLPFVDLSVAENILTGSLPTKGLFIDWPAAKAKAKTLLEKLGSSLSVDKQASSLSIADQQMLELAAALAHDAKVWIFDETTAPLTPNEVKSLFRIMRELRDQGCALAIVTHHLEEVFEIADEITVLRDGAKVAHLPTASTTPAEIVRLMVGRELAEQRFGTSYSTSQVKLNVERMGGPGFHDISLKIHAGEVYGLAGLVGSGRTEFARALFGITKPSSGTFSLDGKQAQFKDPAQAMAAGVALVTEDRRGDGLMMNRSILENASLPTIKTYASKLGILSSQREESTVAPMLQQLHTAMRSHHQTVSDLSGGNQQKVVLSKWLLHRPKLLILDEPTRGVDVGAKAEIHKLIRELAKDGISVLLISSDLPEVMALSDRIGVMRRGTLAGELNQSEINDEALMHLATGVTT